MTPSWGTELSEVSAVAVAEVNCPGGSCELFDLVKAAKRNLHRVTTPTLVVQSTADETVKHESGQMIYDGISSEDKRLLWLNRSRHVSTLDVERHVIAE